jgi:hypothetical protein
MALCSVISVLLTSFVNGKSQDQRRTQNVEYKFSRFASMSWSTRHSVLRQRLAQDARAYRLCRAAHGKNQTHLVTWCSGENDRAICGIVPPMKNVRVTIKFFQFFCNVYPPYYSRTRVFEAGGGWEFFSSPPRPEWLWGPPSLPSNGYQRLFPRG